jgi:Mor family transcriptional regulator
MKGMVARMLNKLLLEDIPPELRYIPELIGMDAYLILVEKVGGGHPIYIPKLAEVKRKIRDAEIYKKYNGKNHTELAREFDLSDTQVKRIIKKYAESGNVV